MKTFYKGDYKKGEIEITDSDIAFENRYAVVYNDSVIFPSGYKGSYIRLCNTLGKSIAVLPVTKDNKILLIKNFRHGVRKWGYEIPKGGVEDNEDYEEAARRELNEETGYKAEGLRYIGEYCDSPAVCDSTLRCFVALNCEKSVEISCEKTEAIETVIEVDPEAFLRGEFKLDFNDALTELLVYKYIISRGENENGEYSER